MTNFMMHRVCHRHKPDIGFDHSFFAMRDYCDIARQCMRQVGMGFAYLVLLLMSLLAPRSHRDATFSVPRCVIAAPAVYTTVATGW